MKLVMSIVYVAVLGVLAHYIGESLPRIRFSETGFFYRARDWENGGAVYEKNRNQEMEDTPARYEPHHADMLPKRVTYDATSESLTALIRETCVAEFIHCWLCVFSFGIYLIWKNYIGIILMFVFIFCNIPFILIQRYNRPHLIKLRDRMLRREIKKQCDC